MNYTEFKERVRDDLAEHFDGEMVVKEEKVGKDNGVWLDGLSVHREGAKASPVIYLDVFYEAYEEGQSIEELEELLIRTFEHYSEEIPFDPDLLEDLEYVKPRLVCRVVNTEKNRTMLEGMPHREFLNLSVIYYILMEDLHSGVGGVKVSNDLLREWGMSEQELDRLARKNTAKIMPWEIHPLHTCVGEEGEGIDFQPPLYVLTNKYATLGAYWITEEDVLFTCAETLGSSCYVLPSSIHECLLLPEHFAPAGASLSMLVRDINEAALDEKDILADNAYFCDLKTRTVTVAKE